MASGNGADMAAGCRSSVSCPGQALGRQGKLALYEPRVAGAAGSQVCGSLDHCWAIHRQWLPRQWLRLCVRVPYVDATTLKGGGKSVYGSSRESVGRHLQTTPKALRGWRGQCARPTRRSSCSVRPCSPKDTHASVAAPAAAKPSSMFAPMARLASARARLARMSERAAWPWPKEVKLDMPACWAAAAPALWVGVTGSVGRRV